MAIALLAFSGSAALSNELLLPTAVTHNDQIHAIYRFDRPVTGHVLLDATWTDVLGRLVQHLHAPLDLTGGMEVPFSLDAQRALTAKNLVNVRVSLDETDQNGKPVHSDSEASASIIISPPGDIWSDYQIIMWQSQSPAGYAALKRLGVTGAMVESNRSSPPGTYVTDQVNSMLNADLHWYLENIATDFYSSYHKSSGNRSVNWRFHDAKERYWANRQDKTAFFREPSLSDQSWIRQLAERLTGNVLALRQYRPLFYNLADEPGIADLSAFWDFDLSPTSLAGMRDWLKTQYGGLAQLNDEWGTAFQNWDEVVPTTTQEAMTRGDQNFAAWGDFKEWMDIAFARALQSGTAAIHAADPAALSAIEGGQIPGWGGYDYSRLAKSVDLMELGSDGDADELLRSFNPKAVMLTTSFGSGPAEEHQIWRELLRGTRGLILWDSANQFVGTDGSIGDRGRAAAPYFKELRNGLGALVINSHRDEDPIAILYSPESMRIEWLLERTRTGEDWSRRNASSEYEDTPIRVSLLNFARAIEHMGLQQRFVTAEQVERGALEQHGYRVLILPSTISLSHGAADAIHNFVKQGGTVIADGEPGTFDEHGRKLQRSSVADVFSCPTTGRSTQLGSGRGEAICLTAPRTPEDRKRLGEVFAAAGIKPMITLTGVDGRSVEDVETYRFSDGAVTLVGLMRDNDPSAAVPEPNDSEAVELQLPQTYNVYDITAGRWLDRTQQLQVKLGRVAPAMLALLEAPIPALSISGPGSLHLGDIGEFRLSVGGFDATTSDVFDVQVADPLGNAVPYYATNLVAPAGLATYRLPLAYNDKAGQWTLKATDLLSGAIVQARLQVEP